MSRGSESGIDNRLFGAIMAALGLTALGLWFFLHPNSPWHTRNTYVVAFQEIGTLAPGNDVMVNGISKGKVISSFLTDSCVWVELEVLATVPVADNSTFTIINSGLMGERQVGIRPGDSPHLLVSGDSVRGSLDMGSTTLAKALLGCLGEIDTLLGSSQQLLDTVLSPQNKARYARIANKGSDLIHTAQSDGGAWIDSVREIVSNLSDIKTTAESILAENKPGTLLAVDSAKAVYERALALRQPLEEVAKRAQTLSTRFETTDNSVGALLSDTALHTRLSSISQQAEALLVKISKSGLDLNADIW